MYIRIPVKTYLGAAKLCQLCRHSSSWNSKLVRSSFISFFQNEHNHKYIPSSSVLPGKGQGTYFTNAGMNQPLFLGTVRPGSRLEGLMRVVNSQKCIRVGGKHNDLQDVGKDLTHHTFFEMLGSWSFGDYFKDLLMSKPQKYGITIMSFGEVWESDVKPLSGAMKEACTMALSLLTTVYGLPIERLYFTYFGGDEQLGLQPDLECRDIWLEAGVPANQLLPFGMKDNFWDMGETGPCGPCTEIHFDHVGGRNAAHLVNADSPDVVEIWNLVFMQYDRKHNGSLEPLPRVHVDTGMGLERMTAVLQGSRSNYDTDLFQPLFNRICKLTGAPGYQGRMGAADTLQTDQAYRTVADHTRMISVAVSDGLLPGRDGLQHKLRLVIYRAFHELETNFGVETTQGGRILGELSEDVVQSLGDTYPELKKSSSKIKEVLRLAAEQFQQLQSSMKDKKTSVRQQKSTVEEKKPGNDGFYRNTFKCEEKTVQFELFLPSVSALHQAGVAMTDDIAKYTVYSRTDAGYDFVQCKDIDGRILGFLQGRDLCSEISQGDTCAVVLDKTCFYSQAGGQAADTGYLNTQHGVFRVMDVQEEGGYVLHIGQVVEGGMSKGEQVTMAVNDSRRIGCMCNHTATHLLNAALRSVLGDSQQMGSDVQQDKFTFDFASVGSLTADEVSAIEKMVQQQIQAGHTVHRHQMVLEEAVQLEGLTMLENEDYPSPVRVIWIGEELSPFQSVELCGGTHVFNTCDLKDFCIVKLTGVSQGTKRATCVTGQTAKQAIHDGKVLESKLSKLISDLTSDQNINTWTEQIKEINTHIKECILPKLVRDSVQDRLDKLGERIKARQNQILQASLQQNVLDLMAHSSQIPVQKMVFDGKQMVKALSGIEVSKPVALVSEGERSSLAIIVAPSQQTVLCEKLATFCQDQLSDFSMKKSVAQCGEDKSALMLTLKGRKTGDKLCSVLTSIVESCINVT